MRKSIFTMIQNMMTFFIMISIVTVVASGCEQQVELKQESTDVQPKKLSFSTEQQSEELTVEAACGQCQFGLAGKGCDLAVRIDGKAYFVDGSEIDEHGDAHAADGFCNEVRQARVQGRIENTRFIASSFELLPEDVE